MSKKEEPAELDQDVARREKYRKLGEAGVPLFPYTAARTHEVAEAVAAFACLTAAELEEKKAAVVVPGRIMSLRRMGRATFFHISDGRQQLQAYVREDKVGAEAYERFALFDLGDIVLGLRDPLQDAHRRADRPLRRRRPSWPSASTRCPRSGTASRTSRSATASATSTSS